MGAVIPFPRAPRLVSLCGWRVGDTGFYRGRRIAIERIDAERRMLAIRCNGGLDYVSPSVLHRELTRGMSRTEQPRKETQMDKPTERAVLVTTAHRGVFFGYLSEVAGTTVHLKRARNCVYWPKEQKGFLGLAATGPLNGARVGPAVDIKLRDITCIAECTAAAVERWEAAPWN